jgi:hypothetical protein
MANTAKDDLESRIEAAQREEQALLDTLAKSRPDEPCDPVSPSDNDDLDKLLADLDMEALAGTETDQEVIESMTAADLDAVSEEVSKKVSANIDDKVSKTILHQPPSPLSNIERSKNVSNGERDRSKDVSGPRSKNVSVRQRRSPANDAKIIAKIRSVQPSDDSSAGTSSVSYPSPSLSHPSTPIKAGEPPIPANGNLIPVWGLTGDTVKVLSASVALQLLETPPVAFTFNLTPEAVAKALGHSAGFLDSLKRSFDLELKRRLPGVVLPYWFAVDVDDDRRLHIHGAFAADPARHSAIRGAKKEAWGEWDGPGKHKQLLFKTPCDDGWATYSMRNQRAVAKIIGPRTFTINHPLRRDAEWVYTDIRRIMREDEK